MRLWGNTSKYLGYCEIPYERG